MLDRTSGRVIRQSISEDPFFNSLSLEAQLLYLLLRPHFNAWGKMKADPHTIKGAVVPLNSAYNPHTIVRCLEEISEKTYIKLFIAGGIRYLHDLNWEYHQPIRQDRGSDRLPSYIAVDGLRIHTGTPPETETTREPVEASHRNHGAFVPDPVPSVPCRGP